MKALVISKINDLSSCREPLDLVDLPDPQPSGSDIIIKVRACGVCHTELDEIEGRTPPEKFPMIPGHEVIGNVVEKGNKANRFEIGDRVGVGWIFSACGQCYFCKNDMENLCADFKATGRDEFGGYAEFMKVREDFAYPIPEVFSDYEAAPLLCAGGVGYRSLRLTGIQNGDPLGLTGFGASGHLVLKLVRKIYPDTPVYVFARSSAEQKFALELGAVWAGDTTDRAPVKLRAVIDTTPAWKPVLEALINLQPGGRLVINAIRKENHDLDLMQKLSYDNHLWLEKEIKSVANVTRKDIARFLESSAESDIRPEVTLYSMEEANLAISELKNRKIRGAKVLRIS